LQVRMRETTMPDVKIRTPSLVPIRLRFKASQKKQDCQRVPSNSHREQ
jgi:hypothetical protein